MKLNPIPSMEIHPFSLPMLPYDDKALEPYVTQRTISYHYGKHHQTYVTNLNNLLQDSDWRNKTLEDIIMLSAKDESKVAFFNNAAQVWNHTFYWHCMKPAGGGKPEGMLMQMLERSFGGFKEFCNAFKQAALAQFGSGWAWLVMDENGKLQIIKTPNADLPMNHGKRALLTIDVWEHAYYLDYQNKRVDYIDLFLNHLVNWDFVSSNATKIS